MAANEKALYVSQEAYEAKMNRVKDIVDAQINELKKDIEEHKAFSAKEREEMRTSIRELEIQVVRMETIPDDIKGIRQAIESMEQTFVKKEDNKLIRNVVIGFIALIVIAFANALIARVIPNI